MYRRCVIFEEVDHEIVTHDPKQPSLHLTDWNDITEILNQVGQEYNRNPERRVEVGEHQAKRPEEPLHSDESCVHLHPMVSDHIHMMIQTIRRTKSSKVKKAPAERDRPVMK